MNRIVSIATLALILCSAAFAQDEAAKRKAAEQAAESWLTLVDRGDYGQSWQEASSFFKTKVSKSDWENALKKIRTPLGVTSHRTLAGSIYQTDLPNVPRGEYVVIQYATELGDSKSFLETITPMLDSDGKWRVSGYFIKPVN